MTNHSAHALPRTSVVLATYKRQDVLPRAIRSVLQQSCPDWELLIVDDEPDDETRRIVQGFADPRIRYLAHPENRGLSAARNTGILHARGRYIGFLDDDDEFLEDKIRLQARLLDESPEETGVVSCFEEIQRVDGSRTSRNVSLRGDVHRRLLANDLVRMQLLTVRSVCFRRIGLFDERLRHHEDFDMTLRLARAFRFETVEEPLVRIIGTEDSLSMNVGNRVRAIETIMSTHPEFRRERRVRARWERRLARHYGELGDNSAWRQHMWASLKSYPFSALSWAAFIAGTVVGPHGHLRLGRLRGRWAKARRTRTHRP